MIDEHRPHASTPMADQLVDITLTPDGRVLLHRLPPELVPIVAQLQPREPQFRKRLAALRRMRQEFP